MTTVTEARDSHHLLITQIVYRADRCFLNLRVSEKGVSLQG